MPSERTYRIVISLWWNYGQADELALPDAPQLGKAPHAQQAMRHLGINYRTAIREPIGDCWLFLGCDRKPDPVPHWMQVYDEALDG